MKYILQIGGVFMCLFMGGFLHAIPTESIEQVAPLFTFEPIDFSDGGIPDIITAHDAVMQVVSYEEENLGLQVNYKVADFPSVKFQAETPWDFGQHKALSFTVTNPTDQTVTLYLRIDDAADSDGSTNCMVSTVSVEAQSTKKAFLSLHSEVLDMGMKNLPPTSVGSVLPYSWGDKELDSSHVYEFQFWCMYPSQETTLIFDDIALIADPNSDISYMNHIVDAFGQYTQADWSGKISSSIDLEVARSKELLALLPVEQAKENFGFSKYGGWADGPQLESTGHFRVAQYQDTWTLVDPEGYLFFSNGVDIVRLSDMTTWITGRENMFEILPHVDYEESEHFTYTNYVARPPLGLTEGWLFNQYSYNLEQKYGASYLEAWKDTSVRRFANWGFTSLGNWAEPSLFFGKGNTHRLAYVADGWTHDGSHQRIPSGNPFWAPLPDPFDPEFRISIEKMVDGLVHYGINRDPWCIGVYVDNEIAWGDPSDIQKTYAVVSEVLHMSSTESYAKAFFMGVLQGRYNNSIALLNATWGSNFTSFDQLATGHLTTSVTDGMQDDYALLLSLLAEQYYKTVGAVLEEKLPNKLYLGSRFAEWGTSLEVQQAAAKYVDVVSFNVYKESIIGQDWLNLEQLRMPIIIGEFHFGSTDRGMFGGGIVNVNSQEGRGNKYMAYMQAALQSPYVVGAHWFQYMDQPLLGRAWDGENYNIGFVDITDTPYPHMVQSAKEIHRSMYQVKFLSHIDEKPVAEK